MTHGEHPPVLLPPALPMPAHGTRTPGVKESCCQPPELALTPIPALRDVELPKQPPLLPSSFGPTAVSAEEPIITLCPPAGCWVSLLHNTTPVIQNICVNN